MQMEGEEGVMQSPHRRCKSVPSMNSGSIELNDTGLYTVRSRSGTDTGQRLVPSNRSKIRLSSGGLLRSQSKKRRAKNGNEKSRSVDYDIEESDKSTRKNSTESNPSIEERSEDFVSRRRKFGVSVANNLVPKRQNIKMHREEDFHNNDEHEQTPVQDIGTRTDVGDQHQSRDPGVSKHISDLDKTLDVDKTFNGNQDIKEELHKCSKGQETILKSRRRSLPAKLSKYHEDLNLDYRKGHERDGVHGNSVTLQEMRKFHSLPTELNECYLSTTTQKMAFIKPNENQPVDNLDQNMELDLGGDKLTYDNEDNAFEENDQSASSENKQRGVTKTKSIPQNVAKDNENQSRELEVCHQISRCQDDKPLKHHRRKKPKQQRRTKSLPALLVLEEIPEVNEEEGNFDDSLESIARLHVNKAFCELLRRISINQAKKGRKKVRRTHSLSTIQERLYEENEQSEKLGTAVHNHVKEDHATHVQETYDNVNIEQFAEGTFLHKNFENNGQCDEGAEYCERHIENSKDKNERLKVNEGMDFAGYAHKEQDDFKPEETFGERNYERIRTHEQKSDEARSSEGFCEEPHRPSQLQRDHSDNFLTNENNKKVLETQQVHKKKKKKKKRQKKKKGFQSESPVNNQGQPESLPEDDQGQRMKSLEDNREQPKHQEQSVHSLDEDQQQPKHSLGWDQEQPKHSLVEDQEKPTNSFENDQEQPKNYLEDDQESPRNVVENDQEQPKNSPEDDQEPPRNVVENDQEQPKNSPEDDQEQPRHSLDEDQEQPKHCLEDQEQQKNSLEKDQEQHKHSLDEDQEQPKHSLEDQEQQKNSFHEGQEQHKHFLVVDQELPNNYLEDDQEQPRNSVENDQEQPKHSLVEDQEKPTNYLENDQEQPKNSFDEDKEQHKHSLVVDQEPNIYLEDNQEQPKNYLEDDQEPKDSIGNDQEQPNHSLDEDQDQHKLYLVEDHEQTTNYLEDNQEQSKIYLEDDQEQPKNSLEDGQEQPKHSLEEDQKQTKGQEQPNYTLEEDKDQAKLSIDDHAHHNSSLRNSQEQLKPALENNQGISELLFENDPRETEPSHCDNQGQSWHSDHQNQLEYERVPSERYETEIERYNQDAGVKADEVIAHCTDDDRCLTFSEVQEDSEIFHDDMNLDIPDIQLSEVSVGKTLEFDVDQRNTLIAIDKTQDESENFQCDILQHVQAIDYTSLDTTKPQRPKVLPLMELIPEVDSDNCDKEDSPRTELNRCTKPGNEEETTQTCRLENKAIQKRVTWSEHLIDAKSPETPISPDLEFSHAIDTDHVTKGDITEQDKDFDGILRDVINSCLEPDYSTSKSAVHRAVAQGSVETLVCLIEDGVDVNGLDEHGWPPLHVAMLTNNVDCAAVLLDAGADLQHYTDALIQEYRTVRKDATSIRYG